MDTLACQQRNRDTVKEVSKEEIYVEVLVDKAPARLGSLSYRYHTPISVGTAVEVPFGKRIANGVVIGPGNPEKATRDVIRVWGSRIDEADISATRTVAAMHFASLAEFAARFAPNDNKGDEPLDAGPIETARDLIEVETASNKLLLRTPDVDPAELAAAAANQLATETGGQILVICPSKKMATQVTSMFSSGAARLDAEGAWAGFRDGSVSIGVTTRNGALWSPQALGGIVVAEEDHPGHIELRSPHTNARDVAVQRAAARHLPITLTSASPTGAGLGAGVKVAPVGNPFNTVIAHGERKIPAQAIAHATKALRAGKTVGVFAKSSLVTRRCAKCHDPILCQVPECRDGRCDHEVQLTCQRCNGTGTYLAGVDCQNIIESFPDGVTAIDPTKPGTQRFDMVVYLNIDAVMRRPGFNPEHGAMRAAMSAAELMNEGGTLVIATSNDPDTPVIEALSHSQVAAARMIWKRCAEDQLAPFGLVVKLQVAANHAPRVDQWPGQVLGPLKTGDKQWEILVRLSPGDVTAFERHLNNLRSKLKVRYQLI